MLHHDDDAPAYYIFLPNDVIIIETLDWRHVGPRLAGAQAQEVLEPFLNAKNEHAWREWRRHFGIDAVLRS